MRIAIVGHRGIPGNYGGFETFAEELSVRLIERGHHVINYCRANNWDYSDITSYRGSELVVLPTLRLKQFDTIIHTLLSALHLLTHPVDVVLMVNPGNASLSWIPRLRGTPVALNVDGLEWERKKWGALGRTFLRFSSWVATWAPTVTITDAEVIRQYYRNTFGRASVMIPYGANVEREPDEEEVRRLGLEPGRYILFVSRFEPENNPLMVRRAFEGIDTDLKLAMVGDAPYAKEYIAQVKDTSDDRIRFLGFVFGQGYKALQKSAYAYVQATEVGGTHPALIEALGYGNLVLARGTPENREVMQGAGRYFDDEEGLRQLLQEVVDAPDLIAGHREAAMRHIRERYSWDRVTDQYEDLLESMVRREAVPTDS
jgi:glycosyltransferase involved in cell wall biosynthesis